MTAIEFGLSTITPNFRKTIATNADEAFFGMKSNQYLTTTRFAPGAHKIQATGLLYKR